MQPDDSLGAAFARWKLSLMSNAGQRHHSTGRPGLTVVRVGTMDNPSSVKPSANIWSASAPAWACLDAALERIEHQPAPLRPAQNAT